MSSILQDIKKVVNIPADYTAFDVDITLHINAVFSTLHQLGVGPSTTYELDPPDADWDVLDLPTNQLSLVKTYMGLKVRMLFDPPGTSFVIEAVNEQIKELEHRLVAAVELTTLADT